MLNVLSSSRLHLAGTRHVASFRAEQPGIDVAVHGLFSYRELILLRFEDVMNRLSFLNPPVNLLAEDQPFLLRDVRAGS